MSNKQTPQDLKKAAGVMGRKGGPARDKKLTKKRKVEIASEGGKAASEKRRGRG